MKLAGIARVLISGGLLAGTASISAQQVDPEISAAIAGIRAIDNHAHPVLATAVDPTDKDFDALPVDSLEAETDAIAVRPDFPLLGEAWRALYGFTPAPPLDEQGKSQLDLARRLAQEQHGANFPAWVLDEAGIDTMLANRVSMGTGIQPPRFRWVPYVDTLLFPLDNSGLARQSPDRKAFFALEDLLRGRYLRQNQLVAVPPRLTEYLDQVVTPTLERHKAGGAVAEKFEVAYLRSFDFGNPRKALAESIYAHWARGGVPDEAQYKVLQDFLFHYIAQECGRLGLAVHLHSMAGYGSYFSIAGVNPMLLEPLFNDPKLRKTHFVMLHGGWPYVREIGALLQKPNVYLDISSQAITITPHTQAQWLREWLELVPEKVLFGTDGYPYTDALDWPESTWIASHNARQALGIALTGMVADGEISKARALELARMVLRGNAAGLYGLADIPTN
jgi:hypothetical protein